MYTTLAAARCSTQRAAVTVLSIFCSVSKKGRVACAYAVSEGVLYPIHAIRMRMRKAVTWATQKQNRRKN